jgi:hypothetical protein
MMWTKYGRTLRHCLDSHLGRPLGPRRDASRGKTGLLHSLHHRGLMDTFESDGSSTYKVRMRMGRPRARASSGVLLVIASVAPRDQHQVAAFFLPLSSSFRVPCPSSSPLEGPLCFDGRFTHTRCTMPLALPYASHCPAVSPSPALDHRSE